MISLGENVLGVSKSIFMECLREVVFAMLRLFREYKLRELPAVEEQFTSYWLLFSFKSLIVVANNILILNYMFHLKPYSYRFAEQVLNSKLAIKQEIKSILQMMLICHPYPDPISIKYSTKNFGMRDGNVNHVCLMNLTTLLLKWIF